MACSYGEKSECDQSIDSVDGIDRKVIERQ